MRVLTEALLMRSAWCAALMALGFGLASAPASGQAMKNVEPMITRFGKSCVQPEINMETFGKELWQARGLILVDILVADGPGESLMGFIFDTDLERFKATFPEFAKPQTFKLPRNWTAKRTIEMTRFQKGDVQGSTIPRPMILCTAKMAGA